MLSARIWDSENDEVTYKNFKTREEVEGFFREAFFLFAAEIKTRGNLLPIGSKQPRDKTVEWHDE